MKEDNFQEAIKHLLTDDHYLNSLTTDPDRLMSDHHLNVEHMLAINPSDKIDLKDGNVRPAAFCCCCCGLLEPDKKQATTQK